MHVTKPVARLHILAQGNNVTNMSIRQDGPTSNKSGIQQYKIELPSGVRFIEESFASAFGSYIIDVTTNDGVQPILAHKIE
jgi:hypothetical protein